MKKLDYEEFDELCDKLDDWPQDFMSLDAMSLPGYDLFEMLDEALKPFGLELLMADTGADDYAFKIIPIPK